MLALEHQVQVGLDVVIVHFIYLLILVASHCETFWGGVG